MCSNMKLIFFLSLLMAFASCGKTKSGSSRSQNTVNSNIISEESMLKNHLNDLYHSLPLIDLPLSFHEDVFQYFDNYKNLNEKDYHYLTDIADMKSHYSITNSVARVPEKENLKFIITRYYESDEEPIMELYSLSDDLIPKDRLQLFFKGKSK